MSVFKIAKPELPLKVQTPRVQLSVLSQGKRMLRTASYLLELG